MSGLNEDPRGRVAGKLVRDRIPEIVSTQGATYTVRLLDDAEFRSALLAKIQEEAVEAAEATDDQHLVEELADVLEVVHALAAGLVGGLDNVEAARVRKRAERGGFDGRVLMSDYRPG